MGSFFLENMKGTCKARVSGILRIALIGLSVLVQVFLILLLSYWLIESIVYIYLIIEIASLAIVIQLVNDNRSTYYKRSWICLILLLPIAGHIMFVLWGITGSKGKMRRRVMDKIRHGEVFLNFDSEATKEFAIKYPDKSRMSCYLESQHFPLFKNNQIMYYPMGEDAFEMILLDIKKAQKFILIDFFIIAEGVLWSKMHELLLQKIRSGIMVKLMYDDLGTTLRIPKRFKKVLEAEGFEIAVYNPIFRYTEKLYLNYRNHQKIVVIDGNYGYTGGFNIADEYVNLVNRHGVWKDNSVRVEGDAVWGLTVTFLQMWEVCKPNEDIDYNFYRPTKSFEQNDVYCHVIADGPANNPDNPIEISYKQIIQYAKKYVYITTPYLSIDDDMKEALITAVKCGIDVRIITPFIPDKKYSKALTNYYYGPLLKAGVKIYEYKPGFIHAKTIINEDCGIVGTINMDYRSFYLHYECGVWMCNREVIDVIKDDIQNVLEVSRQVNYEEWKNRPWYLKIYQNILNLFAVAM